MASRPKRTRKSTDSQPEEMPAVATTDTVERTTPSLTRQIIAAIIPTIEQTCREIITRQTSVKHCQKSVDHGSYHPYN